MKAIIILNTETGICEHYETDGETLCRVHELLNNRHDEWPRRVPPTVAQKTAENTKTVKTPSPIEDKPEPGKQYALTIADGSSIASGNTWQESEVKPKVNGDQAFMASLQALMSNN